jgi:glycerol kinase
MEKFILSIDQGTTGSTAVLIKESDFTFFDKVNQEFPQIFPKPSWVEHDLNDIWKSVSETIQKVLEKNSLKAEQISCIGITNQRETTCAFDKDSKPLANAIVWQDRRTAPFCEELVSQGKANRIKELTGLPIDAYFSGTKMKWLLENNKEVQNAAQKDELLFGTIDTFLLHKLTKEHKTEVSNASRTLLMDLQERKWNSELLETFKVDQKYLPEICDSFHSFGETKGLDFLPDGIPVTGILGDQQAALFGQAGINEGDMKCTYGTGAFMLLNIGEKIKYSNHGLLTTLAYQQNGKPIYAFEGSCYIAGAAIQWLRDNLNLFAESPESECLAASVENLEEMENILFFPFFTGIASPYWKSEAKAAIIGLTRDTNKNHLTRACLEGVAYSINDLIKSLENDLGQKLKTLKVDGGMCANNLFCDMQANTSDLTIIRPKVIETTAYGAGLAAAIGKGQLTLESIGDFWKSDREFPTSTDQLSYFSKKYDQWSEKIKVLF